MTHDPEGERGRPRDGPAARAFWDARYGASECVWGAGPNRFVVEAFEDVPVAGRVLDLACGEGRNAIWLAARGWRVTAVDFSPVALERGCALAAKQGVSLEFVEADVTRYRPEPGAFAQVLIAYLQVPGADRRGAFDSAARALAPGGRLFAVAHALRNLQEGTGGPRDPGVLWDPAVIAAELAAVGLTVDGVEEVERPVEDAPRPAIDVVARAHRAA